MDFGDWLKSELVERRISMAELARMMHVNPGAVSRWASNQRLPDPESCRRIALALGISQNLVLEKAGHESVRDLRADQLRQEIAALDAQRDELEQRIFRAHEELATVNSRLDASRERLYALEAQKDGVDRLSKDLFDLIESLGLSSEKREMAIRKIRAGLHQSTDANDVSPYRRAKGRVS